MTEVEEVAEIYEGIYMVPKHEEDGVEYPEIVGDMRVLLPCGCYVLLGKRMDNQEFCIATIPQGTEEQCRDMMHKFHERLNKATQVEKDKDKTVIGTVVQLLNEVYAERS